MKSVNKVLFSTRVVKCCKHALCDRKSVFSLILLPSLICLSLVGCVSTRHAPASKSTPPTAGQSKEVTKYHTVQKGDTLYSIAKIYSIDYKDLAEWNNIENPGAINVGQQLMVSSPNQMANHLYLLFLIRNHHQQHRNLSRKLLQYQMKNLLLLPLLY